VAYLKVPFSGIHHDKPRKMTETIAQKGRQPGRYLKRLPLEGRPKEHCHYTIFTSGPVITTK